MRVSCPSLPSAWATSSWPWHRGGDPQDALRPPGGNHPVKDLEHGRAYITSQNHGYVVTAESVDPAVAEVSHINVNEGSVEGLRYRRPNCFTVQFHPEAAPGPMDTEYLFDRFVDSMKGGRAHA